MTPCKDPEIGNANQWENDSVVSISPSAHHQGLSNTQQQLAPRGQGSRNPSFQASNERFTPPTGQENRPYRQHQDDHDKALRSQGFVKSTPPRTHATPPHQQRLNGGSSSGYSTPRTSYLVNRSSIPPTISTSHGQHFQKHGRGYAHSIGHQRSRNATSKDVKSKWATPAPLVTTRKAILNDDNAAKEAEMIRLRSKPERDIEFSATGYYLWPKGPDPMKMFDPALKAFDLLRETYKVHIDWNEKMHCLRLNCIAHPKVAEQNIADAIQGIKQRYLDAQAQIISTSPLYIVVPPSTEAIRSIVQPRIIDDTTASANALIKTFQLTGERLTPAALAEWDSLRQKMSDDIYKTFRTHLFRRVLELRDLRSWMRMRVQFGHINLSQYQNDFLNGKYSFIKFADMMKKSRVASGGIFDRKMDPLIAKNVVQRIVGRSKDFTPRNSKTPSLGDVVHNPRHTEIIFIVAPGDRHIRLEAEIESVQYGALGKYQIGHTRLFTDDGRNKRVEITTSDIESKFDWTLEIIQDSEQKNIPQALRNFIAASLVNQSSVLVDPIGLPYPAFSLRAPVGFAVKKVVMRSVFQYQWIQTANVVEVAIYREWYGFDTRPEPKMQASISMFNPDWDTEMGSIENTTFERQWDEQLSNFFGKKEAGKRSGLKGFMIEIREVQRLLSDAAIVVTSMNECQQEEHDHLQLQISEARDVEKKEALTQQREEDEYVGLHIREVGTVKEREAFEHQQEGDEHLQLQIREIREAEEGEKAIGRQIRECGGEGVQRQIQELQKPDEIERRQEEITKKRAAGRAKPFKDAATVYTPLQMGSFSLTDFDDTPATDGSLI